MPGGYREAVEPGGGAVAGAARANAHDPDYTLTVSAPTNADARAIRAAIRAQRRAVGEARDRTRWCWSLRPDRRRLRAAAGGRRPGAAVRPHQRRLSRTAAAASSATTARVLEVRGLGAAGITLRNAQGREGLVKWDTLRDRDSGRIRLTYGDVLSIDATQGLTSSEHIEAMPAGTRAVNAYKAYTQASRHRQATYLVVSDGAERQEIAGRRPLGDLRPIREADVWANMARNLARAPEKASALAFLESARDLRHGAAGALQAGLRPAEQRQAAGKERTTLQQTWQQRRVSARVAGMGPRLREAVQRQGAVLERMREVVPLVRQAVGQAIEAARPLLRRTAERVRQRQELEAIRAGLLRRRMQAWREAPGHAAAGPGMERLTEADLRREIGALPEPALRARGRRSAAAGGGTAAAARPGRTTTHKRAKPGKVSSSNSPKEKGPC